jgi:integrating conjugative element protein (TIGR03761 family)
MNKMKRGAEQDDPYSDWWMLRIEDKLADTKTRLQTLREQVDQAWPTCRRRCRLGENLNVQPVKLPLFVNAQLGFMAVYLLADYDDLARKLILAHHTALIDRSTLERWLNDGAHALRSLFSLAQQYRYSGTHARRLRGEERRGASGAGEVRRVAAGRAGRHAPLALRATHRAPDDQARHAACRSPPSSPMRRLRPDGAADGATGDEGANRMTASNPISHSTRFVALEQADFQRLEHAGYLKGLLQPFKGKGSLETWASQCAALRDDVIGLAQRRVLPQARAYPFSLLPCNWPSRPLAQGRPSCAGATSTVPPWAWRCGRPCWPTPRRRPR